MARPFRLQPPAPPGLALVRDRLLSQLADRWTRRLVTVVAGAGFGKTALLAAALAEDRPEAAGRDVWLSCEPADATPRFLVSGLATGLGLPLPADLDRVLEVVWSEAPRPVCFVLDNVQEIASGSAGAATLRRLIDELPTNGHIVLASRDKVPVPIARLAAGGDLTQIRESDLLLDDAELVAFAAARGVDLAVIEASGGWPALAELAASARADLVVDYLWEEVLAQIGPERSRLLAMLVVAGGGDDALVSTLVGRAVRVADVVAGVPLVEHAANGWSALHPLWGPPLRRLLTDDEADEARRAAASVHQAAHRLDAAAELYIESEHWAGLISVMRVALLGVPTPSLGRWLRELPPDWRGAPEALLATAVEVRARSPLEALPTLTAANEAFRAVGDVDGEAASIMHEGNLRWLANDIGGLFALFPRAEELAAAGSTRAVALIAIGRAALSHLTGDSAGVFEALAPLAGDVPVEWLATTCWFTSVAHRRNGDLAPAYDELDRYEHATGHSVDAQIALARLRTDWLAGHVDHVRRRIPDICAVYEDNDRYLLTESTLELASKAAWLGDLDDARALVVRVAPTLAEMPGALAEVLHLITTASIAIGEGDQARATSLLRDSEHSKPGRPSSWYWRDRGALALPFVLLPDARKAWLDQPSGPAHEPGLAVARALAASREDDLTVVKALAWPPAGIVRAHLPLTWVVELAAAGSAAGNPPPRELLDTLGASARAQLRTVIRRAGPAVAAGARDLLARVPAVPSHRLRVDVVGPLELRADGEVVEHPHLRRRRVRELLCLLVVRRQARREALADDLWPELDDPGRNLRTNLNYLQQVLQPDRSDGDAPYFVRADGAWLALAGDDHLEVDAWLLEHLLDRAEGAERANTPSVALEAYQAALPLWRGEPYEDAAEGWWVQPERTRLRGRYTSAAIRAGELLLAAGDTTAARAAGYHGVAADPAAEPAHRLVIRAHLAEGNASAAVGAVEDCRAALADLGLGLGRATTDLIMSRRSARSLKSPSGR